MSYRVLFFGTASFSVPLLEALAADSRFSVCGVVTQPNRPAGRKGVLTSPATKRAAEGKHIPVFQFETVKDTNVIQQLSALRPDIIVVASFGQIIPQTLLDAAPQGAINFHWSLLPLYRGASPVQAAIIHGDQKTGATIMLMDAKMDHGPILNQFEEPILPEDTADALYHRLGAIGAPILTHTIANYLEGTITPRVQIHTEATFVKLLSRDDGRLDPLHKTAQELERIVRAYYPWPGTYLPWKDGRLKIQSAAVGPSTEFTPGTAFDVKGIPAIACLEGTSLLLSRVQPESKAAMDGASFLRGRQDWLSYVILPA